MIDASSVEPPVAPSPPVAGPTPRYVYLTGRLRRREITMEEATELFSIQQGMLRAAQTALPPPPPGGTPSTAMSAAVPMPGSAGGLVITDDALWTGLLFFGAGAGVLAAVLRRASADRGGSAATRR